MAAASAVGVDASGGADAVAVDGVPDGDGRAINAMYLVVYAKLSGSMNNDVRI